MLVRDHTCISVNISQQIGGIGKVSESMLRGIDVITCTDLYTRRAVIYQLYSDISFQYFMRICKGLGSTRVERYLVWWCHEWFTLPVACAHLCMSNCLLIHGIFSGSTNVRCLLHVYLCARGGERKSISNERTFSEINKPAELYDMCCRLSKCLADDMESEEIVVSSQGIYREICGNCAFYWVFSFELWLGAVLLTVDVGLI